MRKISILLIIAMLFTIVPFYVGAETTAEISVGDYVKFGSYSGNAILWRCLKTDSNGYYLISDRILTLKSFDAAGSKSNDPDDVRVERGTDAWADSSLRVWLNSSDDVVSYKSGHVPSDENVMDKANGYNTEKGFLSADNFTSEEVSLIKPVSIPTVASRVDKSFATEGTTLHSYVSKIGASEANYESAYKRYSEDKVFLPSIADIELMADLSETLGEEYFLARPTETAVEKSEYAYRTLDKWKNYFYWVRDPVAFGKGDQVRCVYNVSSEFNVDRFTVDAFTPVGSPRVVSTVAYNDGIGVRPALYINSNLAEIDTGSGTVSAPYEFSSTIQGSTDFKVYTEGSLFAADDNLSVISGNKLLFTKATAGLKYYHNDAEITVEDGVIDGTIALPVSAGINKYQAKLWLDSVAILESEIFYVYGITDSAITEQSAFTGVAAAWSEDTVVKGYLTDGTADQKALANAVYDTAHASSKVYTAIKEGVSSETYVNLGTIGTGKNALFSTDVLINGTSADTENGHILYAHTDDAGANYFKVKVSGSDNDVSILTNDSTYSTGIKLDSRKWYTVNAYYSQETGKIDCYVDGMLICKDIPLTSGSGLYFSMPYADADKYFANTVYSSDFVSGTYRPNITATIDDEADTITVVKTGLDEFAGKDLKVFVDDVATEDTFLKGTASVTADGAVKVFAAIVDTNGKILNGYYGPLKTAVFDMTVEEKEDEEDTEIPIPDDPEVPVTLSGFELNVDSQREKLEENTYAKLGTSVIFKAPTPATGNTIRYYNNGVLINNVQTYGTDSVVLPVKYQSDNLFVAREFDSADVAVKKSAPVSVYGTTIVMDGSTSTRTNWLGAGDTETVKAYLESGSTATDEQKDFATTLFDYENGVFGRTDVMQSTKTSAASVLDVSTIFDSGDYYIEYFSDVYVNGATEKTSATVYRMFASGVNSYVTIKQDGYLTANGKTTDCFITPNEWHNIVVGIDAITDSYDVYVDGILVAKSISVGSLTDISGVKFYSPLTDANTYYSRTGYGAQYMHVENPAITGIAVGDAVDTVEVTTRDMDGYKMAFYVGEATEPNEIVTVSGGVAVATLEGYGSTEVYAVAVDDSGNERIGLTGVLKSETIFYTSSTIDPMPLLLSLNGSARKFEDANDYTAKAGTWVLFDAIELDDMIAADSIVKYFHNGEEVDVHLSPVANTVEMPVDFGTNTYYAQRYDLNGAPIGNTKSNEIIITGEVFPAENQLSIGRMTTTTNADVSDDEHKTLYNWSTTHQPDRYAGVMFTTDNDYETAFDYVHYKADFQYVRDANGKLNTTSGTEYPVLSMFSVTAGRESNAYGYNIKLSEDGSLYVEYRNGAGKNMNSSAIDTGIDLAEKKWHTIEAIVHKDTATLDVYVNGTLAIKGMAPSETFYAKGAYIFSGDSISNLYVSNSSASIGRYSVGGLTEITVNLTTGKVVVPQAAVPTKYHSDTVAVIGRKADGTIKLETFNFSGSADSKTVTFGSGYEDIFVWKWKDLKPLYKGDAE